ncbi:GLPGLI family protein [Halpernia sp.]|uniref:GLPGLI family protein n=1 Tax=Halpernia sp. TaxID=2782209 RepID=UPI003A95CD0A
MNNKYIFFFLFSFFLCSSQDIKNFTVEYTMIQDEKVGNDSFNEFLILSENQNLYFQYGKSNEPLGIDEVFNNFDLQKLNYVIQYKNTTDVLESGWRVLPKLEFFKDDIPPINWKLLDGEKKILNYNCNRAQGAFRGRTYIVWYTTEIPSKLGPWKLSGLPGLILEAIDSKNMYNYYARKILQNYNLEIPEKLVSFTSKMRIEPIALKTYIKIQNDFLRGINRRNLANMPAGTVNEPNQILRGDLKEIVFEWEIFPEKL